MMPYAVCGWYTPDYQNWETKLRESLIRHAQPHDLVPVEKDPAACWEATTMRKAREVLKALNRHPAKTVIFIDVDCCVEGDLSPLTRLRADVAFFFHPRRRRSGHAKAHIRSGTMVFKPTAEARRFVERWVAISDRPEYGDVDQDALLLAIDTPGVLFEQLDVKWCCTKSDRCSSPVIVHDSASKSLPKISSSKRRLVHFAKRLFGQEPYLLLPQPAAAEPRNKDHLLRVVEEHRREGGLQASLTGNLRGLETTASANRPSVDTRERV